MNEISSRVGEEVPSENPEEVVFVVVIQIQKKMIAITDGEKQRVRSIRDDKFVFAYIHEKPATITY